MKVNILFQRLARVLLMIVIMSGFLVTPNQSTSARPLSAPFTDCASQTEIPEAECNALVALYNSTDGANWTNHTDWLQTDTPCSWHGVICDSGKNVKWLYLYDNQLIGAIPTELGNLTQLTDLRLYKNQLSGTIPPELGNLIQLESLDLQWNQLTGSIPAQLGNLTQLRSLSLHNNQLTGAIPTQLGSLTQLTFLDLSGNQLTGTIPTQLGSLTQLTFLDLSGNQLTGTIPTELGSLTNLTGLVLSGNQLTGTIPTELGNLTNLTYLGLSGNQLSGEIPASFVNLTSLGNLTLDCGLASPNQSVTDFINNLIPGWSTLCIPTITNVTPNYGPASGGINVTISGEKFTGASSVTFGGESAFFTVNSDSQITATSPAHAEGVVDIAITTPNGVGTSTGAFTYSFPFTTCATINGIPETECNALVALYNSTDGANWVNNTDWLQTDTPCSWYGVTCAAGTNVTGLDMGQNNLSGTIPTQLGSLTNLTRLYLYNNQLTGAIPTELGSLTNLTWLDLSSNQLTGTIPTQLGSLTNLTQLFLVSNQLTGTIPTQLGSLTNLTWLNLYSNQLTGTIPTQLGSLTNLTVLSLGGNQLTGTIPTELGSLTNLMGLYLSNNQLTGTIPTELGNLANLTWLNLDANQLTGSIPAELGSLTRLEDLSLNDNQLSGEIPASFVNLTNLGRLTLDCGLTSPNQSVTDFITNLIPDWQTKCLPMIEYVYPNSGLASGGTSVILWGAKFTDASSVTFGGENASFTVNSDWQITVTSPAHAEGVVDIAITTPNGVGISTGAFTYSFPFTTCADQTQISETECLALVALYNSTDGANWTNNTGWLLDPPCNWHGVTCVGGQVVQLEQWNNNLFGTIPTQLGNLTNLASLWLSNNQLSGTIPSQLGNLTNLMQLGLAANHLSGSIPTELGNLTNLSVLNLYSNQLTGTIPTELGNLINLMGLELSDNQLNGSIPTQLGSLKNLTYLYLWNNQLTGSIPAGLGSLTQLQRLYLNGNQLNGEFPASITSLTNLSQFGFDKCAGLISTDPSVIAFLNNIAPDWDVCDQEISVWKVGSGAPIPNGDITPSLVEGTDFEVVRVNEENFYGFKVMNAGIKTNLQLTGNPPVQISGDPSFTVTYQPYSTVWANSSWGNSFGIRFSPTSTGLHTATVSIASNDADENPYTFTIQGIGAKKDFYESDNDFSTAKIISPGVTQDHSIFPAGDHDYVKFTLTSPSSVVLETSGLNGYDTEIALYDASHKFIGYDNDGGIFMYSRLERTCGNSLPAGTYYLMTYIYEGVIPQYQLAFSTTPCATISGNAGVAGAILSYTDGTPKTAIANASGIYSFAVSNNWSGTVTPSKAGYIFSPLSSTYTHVLSNKTQNYTANAGRIISGNAGVAGAILKYTDGTLKTATADANGNYSFTVPNNWSGTVTPYKSGYTFSPAYKSYTHVLANQTAQNYRTVTNVTFYSTAVQDGWVLESSETSNAGGTLNSSATTLILGDNNLKRQYRSILSFTTSGLPDTAVITAATLKIKQYTVTGGATFSMFQGLLIDTFKGSFGTSVLQTTDFQSAASKTGVGPFTAPAVGGWYAFNLTTSQAYINKAATGSGLTQFRLRFKLDDNNNAIANYISFYSGNALTASRPQLIIQYYVP